MNYLPTFQIIQAENLILNYNSFRLPKSVQNLSEANVIEYQAGLRLSRKPSGRTSELCVCSAWLPSRNDFRRLQCDKREAYFDEKQS
jgi:hypothetical protein